MSSASSYDVLELKDWLPMVMDTIPHEWMEVIDKNGHLDELRNVLVLLYQKYRPGANGVWGATPKWTEMFNWTSCPVDNIRAVILLKSPNPSKNSDYESTGYAGGIRRKGNRNSWQAISGIPTVWNMFKICNQANPEPAEDVKLMEHQYQNGFNPEYLSKKGILFLNVELSRRRGAEESESDRDVWNNLMLDILKAVPGHNIPLLQWYNRGGMDCIYNGKFLVSKPSIMQLGCGQQGLYHIWVFNNDNIKDYGMELKTGNYKRHVQILQEMFVAFVSSKLQYPAPDVQGISY